MHSSVETSQPVRDDTGKGFGERQVEQMLADRPGMHSSIKTSHPVRAELARCFDGGSKGRRIYWANTNPAHGRVATHAQPYLEYPPHILVTDSPSVENVERWALALFEVYNVGGDFNSLCRNAKSGALSRAEFVEKCVELESQALRKTRNFFLKNPLPANSECRWYLHYVKQSSHANSKQDEIDVHRSNAQFFEGYYDSLPAGSKHFDD